MLKVLSFTSSIALAQLFSAISLIIFTKNLTPEEYSHIALAESIILLLQVIISLSLEKAIQRFSLDISTSRLVFSAILLSSLWLLFLALILLIISEISDFDILFNNFQLSVIVLAAYGYSLSGFFLSKYQFDSNPILYFCTSFVRNFAFFCFSYVLILKGYGTESFFVASFATFILIIFYVLWRKDFTPSIESFDFYKSLVYFSYPFSVSSICSWFINWSNRIFFAQSQSLENLGLLAACQRYSMVFLLFTQGVALVATPKILRFLSDNNNSEYYNTVKKYTFLLFLMSIVSSLAMPLLLSYILDEKYKGILYFIPLFIATYYLSVVTALSVSNYFLFLKKSFQQMKITITVTIASILMFTNIDNNLPVWMLVFIVNFPSVLLDVSQIIYAKLRFSLEPKLIYVFLPAFTLIISSSIFTYYLHGASDVR